MTLGPSLSAFVSFLSYHWLFNVATSFVNGPIVAEEEMYRPRMFLVLGVLGNLATCIVILRNEFVDI